MININMCVCNCEFGTGCRPMSESTLVSPTILYLCGFVKNLATILMLIEFNMRKLSVAISCFTIISRGVGCRSKSRPLPWTWLWAHVLIYTSLFHLQINIGWKEQVNEVEELVKSLPTTYIYFVFCLILRTFFT